MKTRKKCRAYFQNLFVFFEIGCWDGGGQESVARENEYLQQTKGRMIQGERLYKGVVRCVGFTPKPKKKMFHLLLLIKKYIYLGWLEEYIFFYITG